MPPGRSARARAQTWLKRVGLGGFGGRYPHMLSGGQRKRVGLAQVLIRDPKILLMDEPFGPLDAQTRQIMGNLLLDLWSADRKAVLFVTHDLEEAIALSDRVVIMSAGPAARIIGDWRVPLARPRDIAEVKLEPGFHDLHREIWDVAQGRGAEGLRADRGRLTIASRNCAAATMPATFRRFRRPHRQQVIMSRIKLLTLQILVAVTAAGMASADHGADRQAPLLPPFFFSTPLDVVAPHLCNGSPRARSGAISGSRWSRRCSPS